MSDLEGKVVLITGTARGCGRVLAEAFAGAGAKVAACNRDAEAGAQGPNKSVPRAAISTQ